MINEKIYQIIYDEIDKFISGEWEKIVAYFEYGEASYSFSFYIKNKDLYINCYDLPDISEDELYGTFDDLEKIISRERMSEKSPWSNMTIVIDKAGNIKANFDYTDLSNGTYQYKKEWRKKYLI